jgi:hypothetical protein
MGNYSEPYQLAISNGTTTVELAHGPFFVRDWQPSSPAYKGGGVWQSSPLADGRRLVSKQFENITETIPLVLSTNTPNGAIRAVNDLLALVEQAADYGAYNWADTPVYLIAQGKAESNVRYAQVFSARVPQAQAPNGILWRLGQLGKQRSVWDTVDLVCEHGLWQSTAPGTAENASMTVRPDLAESLYIDRLEALGAFAVWPQDEASGTTINNITAYGADLDGTYQGTPVFGDPSMRIGEEAIFYSLGSAAGDIYSTRLNDLFDGNYIRALLWIRTSGLIWTSGNEHYFLKLYADANNYFTIKKTTTDYQVQVDYCVDGILVQKAFLATSATADTEWMSIFAAAAIQGGFVHVVSLYKNGISQGVATAIGAANWDTALDSNNCIIGADDLTGTSSSSADSSYTVLFNGPALTPLQILSISTNPHDTISETNSSGEIMLSNKRTFAPLSHIYTYDSSGTSFSSNLVRAVVPHNILPSPAGNGDMLYCGIESGGSLPTGLFDNLVFSLATPAAGTFTVTWQYYNGGWVTLTTQDNTVQDGVTFGKEGFCSVHWAVPSDWTANSINGVTAYWVRANITAFTSMTAVPQQGTRNVYTNIVNFLDVPTLGGTIPALPRFKLENLTALTTNYFLAGVRRVSRGSNFESIINVSDRQIPAGITHTAVTGAFVSINAPTGRAYYKLFAAPTALTKVYTMTIDQALASNYIGKFAIMANLELTGGNLSEIRIDVQYGTSGATQSLSPVSLGIAGNQWIDFGELQLGGGKLTQADTVDSITFDFYVATDGIDDFYLRMFALTPADEMIVKIRNPDFAYLISLGEYLDYDGAISPRTIRALSRDAGSDAVTAIYRIIGASPTLPQGEQFRVHIISALEQTAFNRIIQVDSLAYSSKLEVAKRYHLMRGDE